VKRARRGLDLRLREANEGFDGLGRGVIAELFEHLAGVLEELARGGLSELEARAAEGDPGASAAPDVLACVGETKSLLERIDGALERAELDETLASEEKRDLDCGTIAHADQEIVRVCESAKGFVAFAGRRVMQRRERERLDDPRRSSGDLGERGLRGLSARNDAAASRRLLAGASGGRDGLSGGCVQAHGELDGV
jgi:hypothetical protein